MPTFEYFAIRDPTGTSWYWWVNAAAELAWSLTLPSIPGWTALDLELSPVPFWVRLHDALAQVWYIWPTIAGEVQSSRTLPAWGTGLSSSPTVLGMPGGWWELAISVAGEVFPMPAVLAGEDMPTFGRDLVAAQWGGWLDVGALTSVEVQTPSGATVDYTTGAVTPTVSSVPVLAIVGPFRPDEVDGLRVTSSDRKVLIPKTELPTRPSINSLVIWDGDTWTQQRPPEPVANDGLWQLQVRQVGEV